MKISAFGVSVISIAYVASLFVGISAASMARADGSVPPPAPPAGACVYADLVAAGMMAKYDKNGDGLLNVQESLEALPQFKGEYSARYDTEWMIEAAYTLELKAGRVLGNNIIDVIDLVSWVASRPFWSYALTPEQLTQSVTAILCRPQTPKSATPADAPADSAPPSET